MTRTEKFWQRITEGIALNQLWKQFRADARSSYRLYSHEIDATQTPGTGQGRHFFNIAAQFFWAVVEKLTPARRILLLIALFFLFSNVEATWRSGNGNVQAIWFGGSFWGGLLLLALLVLEVSDRVVMKRDLQIAKEIQEWLLPANPPQVPGLEIAFATRPANTVAGDYYDVFSRPSSGSPDGPFLIAIADVAGKSVPAAMLMATFQASLKTLAGTASSLTELVCRMNNYACSNSQNGRRFTTTFIAEYDPASRRLIYVNAGHNPPILRRQTGTIERLQAGGIPLGILKDAPYKSATVTLQPGDWLVIFTDGVTEAENNRTEEYGETRLIAVLHTNVAATPSALLKMVMQDLDRFVGDAPQHDDVTLMLLKAS
ncbi:MAG TPA: PP2C family protein-serine/threonine phosphatase [Alloacidobacterium sp.]|nr:PP2C family protein-serine/threonine phosphatase [Alloacidobacterium sp.]